MTHKQNTCSPTSRSTRSFSSACVYCAQRPNIKIKVLHANLPITGNLINTLAFSQIDRIESYNGDPRKVSQNKVTIKKGSLNNSKLIVPSTKYHGEDVFTHSMRLIYTFSSQASISPDDVLGLYLALLMTLFEDGKEPLQIVIKSCKVDLTESDLGGLWIELGLEDDLFYEWLENNVPTQNPRVVYAYLALLSLLLGKRLTGDNYAEWLERRINGVAAKAGCGEFLEFFTEFYPSQVECEALYGRMSSLWRVRAASFHIILGASKIAGQAGPIFQWCLDLLAWSEAGHINKILTELVIKRRTALTVPEFRHEISFLIGAMNYLKSFGELAPYFQLIDEPSANRPTNSRNFKIMTGVAWALTEKEMGKPKGKENNYKGIMLDLTHKDVYNAFYKVQALNTVQTLAEQEVLSITYDRAHQEKAELILGSVVDLPVTQEEGGPSS